MADRWATDRAAIEPVPGIKCAYATACGEAAMAFWLCKDGAWRPYCELHDRLFQQAAKEPAL